MASYVKYNEVGNEGYFDELVKTGLFHDAIGKVISYNEDENGLVNEIEVTTDY